MLQILLTIYLYRIYRIVCKNSGNSDELMELSDQQWRPPIINNVFYNYNEL